MNNELSCSMKIKRLIKRNFFLSGKARLIQETKIDNNTFLRQFSFRSDNIFEGFQANLKDLHKFVFKILFYC